MTHYGDGHGSVVSSSPFHALAARVGAGSLEHPREPAAKILLARSQVAGHADIRVGSLNLLKCEYYNLKSSVFFGLAKSHRYFTLGIATAFGQAAQLAHDALLLLARTSGYVALGGPTRQP